MHKSREPTSLKSFRRSAISLINKMPENYLKSYYNFYFGSSRRFQDKKEQFKREYLEKMLDYYNIAPEEAVSHLINLRKIYSSRNN